VDFIFQHNFTILSVSKAKNFLKSKINKPTVTNSTTYTRSNENELISSEKTPTNATNTTVSTIPSNRALVPVEKNTPTVTNTNVSVDPTIETHPIENSSLWNRGKEWVKNNKALLATGASMFALGQLTAGSGNYNNNQNQLNRF